MSAPAATALAERPAMGFFERWLTLWVFLCIVAGIAFGQALPGPVRALGAMEVARVNIPVGLLIWVMIIPMLLKIDFGALHQVKDHMKGSASETIEAFTNALENRVKSLFLDIIRT